MSPDDIQAAVQNQWQIEEDERIFGALQEIRNLCEHIADPKLREKILTQVTLAEAVEPLDEEYIENWVDFTEDEVEDPRDQPLGHPVSWDY